MSNPPTRTLPTHHRTPSTNNPGARPASTASSSASGAQGAPAPHSLNTLIATKQRELADLRTLRDLSAQVADQLAALRDKLATLSDGTEAVALVLANWHSVLQAIGMAAGAVPGAVGAGADAEEGGGDGKTPLPQTLVRIPVQSHGAQEAAGGRGEEEEERSAG